MTQVSGVYIFFMCTSQVLTKNFTNLCEKSIIPIHGRKRELMDLIDNRASSFAKGREDYVKDFFFQNALCYGGNAAILGWVGHVSQKTITT